MSECKHKHTNIALYANGAVITCTQCGEPILKILRELQARSSKAEQERDELQAHVAVLVYALRLISGEQQPIDGQVVYTLAALTAQKALATTPPEAAERVNKLVEALEAYSSEDTWGDDGEIARQALAEWRGK